jgi:hypothetical protein
MSTMTAVTTVTTLTAVTTAAAALGRWFVSAREQERRASAHLARVLAHAAPTTTVTEGRVTAARRRADGSVSPRGRTMGP